MNLKAFLFPAALLLATQAASAQDLSAAKNLIGKLTAPELWGRGYTKSGMSKAADFLVSEFKSYGLEPLDGKNYRQDFSYPANTFPGKMAVEIDGKKLVPGKDFIVFPESRGATVSGQLQQQDSITFVDPGHKLIVQIKDKLTWSVSGQQEDYTGIAVRKDVLQNHPNGIKLDIENRFTDQFKACNVAAMVKGTSVPDSLLVISAHYDHLGGMGSETYFPGANDNASGTAFLLTLAKYYAAHPQPYSIAFLCFAGEEAGLIGSRYFTEHPLVPLKQIRFLINVDMVGTGESGITVVNASLHSREFELLNRINDAEKYLVKINSRGKAANSDHYFFTEKGVPAFFIYTQGGIAAYHDVYDVAATLPLTEYEDLFRLFVKFNATLMPQKTEK